MESQLLMDDHLLKFNTHTSLLSVALCWMAVGDLGQAQDAIADGCDLCFTYRTSRERQFAEVGYVLQLSGVRLFMCPGLGVCLRKLRSA